MRKRSELAFWIVKRLGGTYALHLTLTLAMAVITLLPPRLFQYFVTALHDGTPAIVGRLVAFGLALAVLTALFSYLNALSREKVQLRIESLLRVSTTRQLLTQPLEAFDGLPRGEFLTRLGEDLSKVETFLSVSMPSHLRYLATLVLAAGLFIWQCGTLALLPLALVTVVAVANYFAQLRLLPLLDELRVLHGGVFQEMLQSFESVRTLRSHRAGEAHLKRFEAGLDRMSTKSLRVVSLAGLLDGANLFSYQFMMAACLAFAAWRVMGGAMDFETALTFPFYLGFFYSSAESLAGAFGEWNRFFVDSRHLRELLPQLTEASQPLPTAFRRASTLQVRDLEVGYRGQSLVAPLAFRVELGKTMVVVGPSGCGKSTLLDVIAGLRSPLAGNLDFAPDRCAVVEQRACVWAGTIRGNLTLETSQLRTDAELWEALEAVGLSTAVRLAGGLDAEVADRGFNFSEGQRYRLALARALLLNSPFLLLDEPFAALDRDSIALVVDAINRDKKQRGYLIVTHQVPKGLEVDGTLELNRDLPEGRRQFVAPS